MNNKVIALLIASVCSCASENRNIEITEYRDVEWTVLEKYENCFNPDTEYNRRESYETYGSPRLLQADCYGVVYTLNRGRDLDIKPGLGACDKYGNVIWEVNNVSDYSVESMCIKGETVLAFTIDDVQRIREYDRQTGNLLCTVEPELPESDRDDGIKIYEISTDGSTLYGTSMFDVKTVFALNQEYQLIDQLTGDLNRSVSEDIYTLCNSDTDLFLGALHGDRVYRIAVDGTKTDTLQFGYRELRPILLTNDGIPLIVSEVIQDICYEDGALWAVIGGCAFPSDSSEIWRVDLNTNTATVIPVSESVLSLAVERDTIYITTAEVKYESDNTEVSGETCLYMGIL